jgi:hypothetical protein
MGSVTLVSQRGSEIKLRSYQQFLRFRIAYLYTQEGACQNFLFAFMRSRCALVTSQSYQPAMRVPGMVYADDALSEDIQAENALQQVANVATLPGTVGLGRLQTMHK